MARRRKGRPVHGWLVLDKDEGLGSTAAVGKLKRLFDAQKVGHAGALDPLATGVLPIAFGEATKTVPYAMDARKRYRFTARWGEATTTDDAEGPVVETSLARPARDAIEAALADFIGEILQTPPQFSAVKVSGERAYDIARDGAVADIAPRLAVVHAFSLVDMPDTDSAVFEAETGKGVYVRALVRDLARALGTVAHTAALRRLSVGAFDLADAVRLDDVAALETVEARAEALLPVSAPLAHLPGATVTGAEAARLRRGQEAVLSPAVARTVRDGASGLVPSVLAMEAGRPVALCALDGLKLQPVRVFNF